MLKAASYASSNSAQRKCLLVKAEHRLQFWKLTYGQRRANCLQPSLTRLELEKTCNLVTGASSGSSAVEASEGSPRKGTNVPWVAIALSLVTLTVAVAFAMSGQGIVLKDYMMNGPLGRSGFLAAFSLILLSEIGDKTFFIAALLAMKVGRWISFAGSVAALAVMTVISVGIGAVCNRIPDAMKSSLPVGEIAGVALLVFFGIKALRDAMKSDGGSAEDEIADAESAVKEAESSGRVKRTSTLASFFEVASLIFLAEWGDRSMLATIALGAAQNPVGVAVGAISGHAIATGIAVLGGAIASQYVNEKVINIISGVLFLGFAAATVFSMM